MLIAFANDDVARRARAAAAAGMLERHVQVLGNVEKRFGLAVMRVRQLAGFEFDDSRLAVDDERYFGHTVARLKPRAPFERFASRSLVLTTGPRSCRPAPPGPNDSSSPRPGAGSCRSGRESTSESSHGPTR